jgi:hypothetical protein
MFNWKNLGTTSRPCGTCTACCVGFLTADIYGTEMKNGRKCKFLDKNCTIYNFRPKLCQDYICEWKHNPSVPVRFKPDISNVIMHWKITKGLTYLQILDRNPVLNQELYDWLKEKHENDVYPHIIYNHYIHWPKDYIGAQYVLSKDNKLTILLGRG